MSFKNYSETSTQYLTQLSNYLTGKNFAPTFNVNIDLSTELNGIRNASSSEQLIQLSNGFYDQVAVKRSLIELYKKPKDYLADYQVSIMNQISDLSILSNNIDSEFQSIAYNKIKSQSIRSISKKLQLKLSLIQDNSNA